MSYRRYRSLGRLRFHNLRGSGATHRTPSEADPALASNLFRHLRVMLVTARLQKNEPLRERLQAIFEDPKRLLSSHVADEYPDLKKLLTLQQDALEAWERVFGWRYSRSLVRTLGIMPDLPERLYPCTEKQYIEFFRNVLHDRLESLRGKEWDSSKCQIILAGSPLLWGNLKSKHETYQIHLKAANGKTNIVVTNISNRTFLKSNVAQDLEYDRKAKKVVRKNKR